MSPHTHIDTLDFLLISRFDTCATVFGVGTIT